MIRSLMPLVISDEQIDELVDKAREVFESEHRERSNGSEQRSCSEPFVRFPHEDLARVSRSSERDVTRHRIRTAVGARE